MEAYIETDEEMNISELPQAQGWSPSEIFYKYQGIWYPLLLIKGAILFHTRFMPQSTDIFLCSVPKCGTTWLKALSFTILTRSRYMNDDSPLLSKSPHDLVPFVEELLASGKDRDPQNPLIQTHVGFSCLPKSILNSNSKIIYICRNPKDVFISSFFFVSKSSAVFSLEEVHEMFCNGTSSFESYWDHVLGYWKASLEHPDKVLFLKYEDLKNGSCFYVKKIADFMGCRFSTSEETNGTVERIIQLCSFENLSNLSINKRTTQNDAIKLYPIPNAAFFRKGKVGDWKNYLTPQMAERIDLITYQKFNACGLHL